MQLQLYIGFLTRLLSVEVYLRLQDHLTIFPLEFMAKTIDRELQRFGTIMLHMYTSEMVVCVYCCLEHAVLVGRMNK